MLQYLFESCLSRSSGPKRFLIILIRDFAVIASREFQLYLSLSSYLFTLFFITWIVICNTGRLSKPFISQPKVSDDFHARQGFLGFKFDEIVLAKAPPESSQQKRSKKVCDKYDISWVTRYNFMNVCEYLIKQAYL